MIQVPTSRRPVLAVACLIAILPALAACGDRSRGNRSVGQVKTIRHRTPMVCPDYIEVDLSLGVLRGNVGSMSKDDLIFAIDPDDSAGAPAPPAAMIHTLESANERGAIVSIEYDERRFAPCWPDARIRTVTIEETPQASSALTPPTATSVEGATP